MNPCKIVWIRAVCTAALLIVSSPVALAQSSASVAAGPQSAAPGFHAPNTSKQVLDHLSAVMHWYRKWDETDMYLGSAGDELYIENGRSLAQQVLQLEFQSALAQAGLIGRNTVKPTAQTPASQNLIDVHNIFENQQQVESQIQNLRTELDAVNRKIPLASAKQRSSLMEQRDLLQGQLELAQALQENMQKLLSFMTNAESANGAATELSGKILALQRTIPGAHLGVTPPGPDARGKQQANKAAALASASSVAKSQGLVGQIDEMFRLMGTLRALDQLIDESADLESATQHLRAPLLADLRDTLKQGQIAIQAAPSTAESGASASPATSPSSAPVPSTPTTPAPVDMARLIQRFKVLSSATLPLSQELVLIEQSESNLLQLRTSVKHEYATLLRSVLLRVAAILFSLGLIWLFSELWRRATFRYIRDARRRRQFLILRRVITGFCMFVVIVLGFVSEFSSLATYAGLITAGIAVALQAIVLSIAAYFFLVGRYGVRVGDRVTVVYSGSSNVSGEVLDIGLVRFYLMELAGSGIDMQPTGRIVMFPNSVLFQTTPLFKQLPGTEYTWRELAFPLHPETNPQLAESVMLAAVAASYETFAPILEKQHRAIEQSMGVHMEVPRPYTRVRFTASGMEAIVRYPIPMREAAAQDDHMVIVATKILRENPAIRLMDGAMPELRAAIKT